MPDLYSMQNADGGWPFLAGSSCTEPTALAALAMAAADGPREKYLGALEWLRAMQRADGGWPPTPAVTQSTWVTSLVLLLPARHLGEDAVRRGAAWLLAQQGRETSLYYRLEKRILGRDTPREELHAGWPWIPGAAAWVSPTAMAILALRRFRAMTAASERIAVGRQFLMARMCADGGWNHGSVRALGIDAPSYPETTGQALLALADSSQIRPVKSLGIALRQLPNCGSAEADAWLRLGLLAHSMPVTAGRKWPCRDTRDCALQSIAGSASRGKKVFL